MQKVVAQYDLDGNIVAAHPSVKEAAQKNNLSIDFLYHLLRLEKRPYKGFIWQAVKDGNPVLEKISGIPVKSAMPQSLRKKLGLTIQKYPFEDLNLLDLEGEIWLPVPDYEEYYMVSNMGRIKWLPRWIYYRDGRKRFEDEKIVRQYTAITKGTNGKQGFTYLVFRVRIEKFKQSMITARIVYSAFVKKLDTIKNDNLYVLHRDLNGCNNRLENLYLATGRELLMRNIDIGYNSFKITPEIREKVDAQKRKPVSQFSQDGQLICTYPSIREAKRQTGIDEKSIILTAKEKSRHAGGFIWCYRTDIEQLDKETLSKYTKPSNKKKHAKPSGKISKAIKQAVDASMYQYPFQNPSLEDLEGEIWKEFLPGDGYIMISNYGRVKRLSYLAFQEGVSPYWKEECILKQTQKSKMKIGAFLSFATKINRKQYRGITARAVYSTFVKPIIFAEDRLVIRFKDGNPSNIVLSNLYVMTRSNVAKIHTQQGIISPPDFYTLSVEKQYNVKNSCKKAVCQYELNGNFIRKFDGLMDAAKYTGNHITNIATSCQSPSRACGGFLWRYGNSTEPLNNEEVEAYRNRWKDRSKPVALYSFDDNLIATYPSIEEAARKTGYSSRLINMAVHEKVKRTRKGIFRFI
jgi:hypothetical protein